MQPFRGAVDTFAFRYNQMSYPTKLFCSFSAQRQLVHQYQTNMKRIWPAVIADVFCFSESQQKLVIISFKKNKFWARPLICGCDLWSLPHLTSPLKLCLFNKVSSYTPVCHVLCYNAIIWWFTIFFMCKCMLLCVWVWLTERVVI